MTGLRSRTAKALKWSYLGVVANLLFTPLSVAVLSRLLTPEEFGLAAFGAVLAAFGALLTEVGVGQALVQRRDLTRDHIRAAFTSSVVLGVLVTGLMWMAAPLAGEYTGNPGVVPVVRGFAAIYVVSALAVVSLSLLRRDLNFKPLMIAEVSAYVLGHGVLGIGAAYLGFGAMSLVVSAAATWIIQLVVSYAYVRHPLSFVFRWAPYRDLYGFGVRMSVLRLLEFIGGSLPTFIIARVFDVAALGLYNRAYNAVGVPVLRLAGSLSRVLVASFSAIQNDLPKLRRAYSSSLLGLSVTLFTLSAGIFVCAPEIVRVLLGERFLAAVPLVQAFAVYIPFPVLSNLAAIVAEATAKLNTKIVLQVVHLVLLAAAFGLVARLGGGVIAFVWVIVAMGAVRAAAYGVLAARILGGGGRDALRAYLIGAGYGLGVGAAMFVVVGPLRAAGTGPFVLLGLELVLGGLLLGAVALLGPESEVRTYARKFARPLRRRIGGWLEQVGLRQKHT